MEEPAPEVIKTSKSSLRIQILILSAILLIVGGVSGYLLKSNPSSTTQLDRSAPQSNPLIKNQSATVYGKIVEKNSNSIKVLGENGESAVFNLAPSILVYKSATDSAITETFAGIDEIDLNKEAVIVLNMFEGEYKVASVSYINFPLPSEEPIR